MVNPRIIWTLLILAVLSSLTFIGTARADVESNDSPENAELAYSGLIRGSVSESGNESDVDHYRIMGKGYYDFDINIVNTGSDDPLDVVLFENYPPDRHEILNTSIQPGKEYMEYHSGFYDEMQMILRISGNGSYEIVLNVYDNGGRIEEPYYDDTYVEEEAVYSPMIFTVACGLFIILIIIVVLVGAFVVAIWMLNKD